jgi:hypothetical protein
VPSPGQPHAAELEREIDAAQLVAMKYPDGSNHLIKGAELIKMKDTGSAECLMYECRFPIFDETLWLAFGDGASQKRAMLT